MKFIISSLLRGSVLLGILQAGAIFDNSHAQTMIASDGSVGDWFAYSVSLSGTTGLTGSPRDGVFAALQGSAFVFRNLDTAVGTVVQNAKLVASDGALADYFGHAVGLSGSIGLVGAYADDIGSNANQGSAYLFRNLDTASGTVTENAKLVASDGASNDQFGYALGLSGSIGLIGTPYGDIGSNSNQGSVYLFRNLHTASGTVNENAKLVASDGAAFDNFGISVSLLGTSGLIGAYGAVIGSNTDQGSAYLFRNLDTASGTVNETAKLVASDGAANDGFGVSVSLSGASGLVGAANDDIGSNTNQGSAYLFRNLDTASGTVNENAKLIASDGAADDNFGISVSLSGNMALVGAAYDDIGSNSNQGSAYLFRNLDTASGTVNESIKLLASDGAAGDQFGLSASLDGDHLIVGAYANSVSTGKAYAGRVSSMTTFDAGNTSREIDGISFITKEDWTIGESTSNNSMTLTGGDSAQVASAGKKVYIGRNAGSNGNTLKIEGELTANEVVVGAAGNTSNHLEVAAMGTVTVIGGLVVHSGSSLGGDGTINGNVTFLAGAKFRFDPTFILTINGAVTLDSTFGVDDILGLDSSVDEGIYTLIDGTSTDFSALGIENWGALNAYSLGGGKAAYFQQGSLELVVIPEPGTLALLVLGMAGLSAMRQRRQTTLCK